MSCTMGSVQSPPTFCTVSETICNRANQLMRESARQYQSKAQAGTCLQEEVVESVRYVLLVDLNGAELGVGVPSVTHKPRWRSSKLHGFWWRMWQGGFVYANPIPRPGMVSEQTRASFALFFDGSRRKHEFLEVAYQVVREDSPELSFDEVGHFVA